MSVLTAVLANARHVAFDVAGLQRPFVERRVEQLNQFVVGTHQTRLNRIHCRLGSRLVRDAGYHRPCLGDGVNLAFIVLRGA